tara:strand:- start:317 stop:1369 length:1053 start_codon:yes stop_codon:yes gene_type:complete
MKKIIFLSLIILFFVKTQNISANQDTFTVDNIIVTDKLTNDNNNKEKYLNTGFKKGFETLVTGILRKEDQKKMLSTDLKTIKSLIDNYRILESGALEEEYIFRLSLKFNKDKIKKFFYDQNIPYSESSSLEVILYPILISNSELKMFSQNKFFEEWNMTEDLKDIKFILPIENIEDINFVKKNIDILEEINLERIVDNYEIKNSAILIFRYNEKKLNVFLKTNFNETKKNNKIEFIVKNLEEKEKRENLISNLKFFINEVWKEENLIDISVPATMTISTKLNKASTLKDITSRLKNINFIESFIIEELNKDLAKIKISYFGKIKNIQYAFERNGFKFEIINDEWVLSVPS